METTKIIEKKCNDIISTIVRQFMFLASNDIFIAGGAIRDLYCNQPVNDYDIYFKTKKLAKRFTKDWVNFINYKQFSILAITKNAITLQLLSGEKVQFITRDVYCGRPDAVIDRFDFTNSMCYYHNNRLILTVKMRVACEKNLLVYNRECIFPINSIKRLVKFMYRGWGISKWEFVRLLFHSITNVKDYKEVGNSSY
jgi:hypothetical protein